MQQFDYIIVGTGASGLMLAYQMVQDAFFAEKRLLLIDKTIKNQNDRTWCFWEKGAGQWDAIVSKQWEQVTISDATYSTTTAITPYVYKHIQSADFYTHVFTVLGAQNNVTMVQDTVANIVDHGHEVAVHTTATVYRATHVFNSGLIDTSYLQQRTYPVLQQHFVGWFVTTPTPQFDAEVATFMDFDVAQLGNTRFMYVLPFSSTMALFEYTLFSADLLDRKAYEDEIRAYLAAQHITGYEITAQEQGVIPMTCYEFRRSASQNVLPIGTAGGWTKPSTGFTFQNSAKKVTALVDFLKTKQPLQQFDRRTRYWYYDLLLLDVLATKNDQGARLFTRLFQKNKVTTILRFLDEETTFLQELRIMASMPAFTFLKAMLRSVFRILRSV